MNDSQRLITEKLQFYATAAYPCSYLKGQVAKSQVVAPSEAINVNNYDMLIRHGFRRSGAFVYRPHCDDCQACLSIRLPVADFAPSRSQKRAYRQHAALSAQVIQPVFSAEHYALYQRYQKARHAGGGMDVDDEAQYTDYLVKTNVQSWMVEFRQPQPDTPNAVLKMISIVDQLHDGLSAVYTFYEPGPAQNLGTFNVLWLIERARALGLHYVYLGYWIADCAKMAYKARFQPCEILSSDSWQRMTPQLFTK